LRYCDAESGGSNVTGMRKELSYRLRDIVTGSLRANCP
jgi:hypothetical protein